MKIAILQCDDVLEKLQPRFGNYPQMIAELLGAVNVDASVVSQVFDVRKGYYPENIDAWDLFITTGSKASVYDRDDWIDVLIDFVRHLNKAGKKMLGICFGHQILALANGGVVEKSTKGWGIGIASNRLVYRPEWMSGATAEINLIVSHQDQISQLPGGTRVIAESDFCRYFMVQWGEHSLSVQGHPEWCAGYSRALINDRRQLIPHARIEQGLGSLEKKADNMLFGRWILEFARHKYSRGNQRSQRAG